MKAVKDPYQTKNTHVYILITLPIPHHVLQVVFLLNKGTTADAARCSNKKTDNTFQKDVVGFLTP